MTRAETDQPLDQRAQALLGHVVRDPTGGERSGCGTALGKSWGCDEGEAKQGGEKVTHTSLLVIPAKAETQELRPLWNGGVPESRLSPG